MMHLSPSTHRRIPLLGCALAVAALATGAILAGALLPAPAAGAVPAAVEAAGATEAAVTIDNFTFAPPVLTVAAGTRVVWTNRDDIPHTVVGAEDPRALRSPPLDTDDRFSFAFAAPGTYRYFCSLHPHMQGTVVVR
jgi:plastocyanin